MFSSKPKKQNQQKSDEEYVVTLTSYPPRFPTLYKCLRTLLSQSVTPDKLVLWIAENDANHLPRKVSQLQSRGLEIKTCPDLKSFKKIIYAYREYPNANLITCDDDVIYPNNWLETLIDGHLEHPEDIICHRARHINFTPNGKPNPYALWPNIKGELRSYMVFPIGVGGVLYPHNSLHTDIDNIELFTGLCPNGDDIWLKTMTLLNGKQSHKLATYRKDFKKIKGSQEASLKYSNIAGDNDIQIDKTFSHYDIIELLKNKTR